MPMATIQLRHQIAETMADLPAGLREAGQDRWRLDGDWLVFEIVCGDALPLGDAAWDLLGRNSGLPGLVKFAWDDAIARSVLRSELPLAGASAASLRESIAQALADLATARRIAATRPAPHPEARCLRDLLEESGWPFTERANGAFAIELEGIVSSPRAILAPVPSGGARAAFEAVSIGAPPPPCRAAIGSMLLCAGGAIRMARPFAAERAERWSIGFEAAIDAPLLSAAALGEAFSTLSIASRFWLREVRGLCDPHLAERVLTLRGWLDPIAGSATETETRDSRR